MQPASHGVTDLFDYLAITDCGKIRFNAAAVLGMDVGLAFSNAPSPVPPSMPKAIDTTMLATGNRLWPRLKPCGAATIACDRCDTRALLISDSQHDIQRDYRQ